MLTVMGDPAAIKFDGQGLVPAVAQDTATGAVLMVAWMNEEAVRRTVETGYAHYFSRSRQSLWMKGATSGHMQKVVEMWLDCDGDTVLMKVEQHVAACHTNNFSCFYNLLAKNDECAVVKPGFEALQAEFGTILDRKANPKEGSYTNYLLGRGIEKICKKVGEEASEVIIAAMKGDNAELRYEIADLLYHVMVAMADRGLDWGDVLGEVGARGAAKKKE